MNHKVLANTGAVLGLAALIFAAPAQAMNFGDMMNPGKWMGGNDNDDYYDGPYGYPGYGYGPYGYPGYGYGYPGYGYGYPGYGYGGYPGYGPGYGAPGYGAPGGGSQAPAPAPAPQ
jgi:hypothetical protein